jgi:hypothetical protein
MAVTFEMLTVKLLEAGREDVVEALGEVYANRISFKDRVDEGYTAPDFASLIHNSFTWAGTTQGHKYWMEIYYDLEDGRI